MYKQMEGFSFMKVLVIVVIVVYDGLNNKKITW